MSNVQLKEGFLQVCVWPATVVGAEQVQAFEEFMQTELKARVQYLEEIVTSKKRSDVFFAVHTEDIPKFALARLAYGMRWLEDVYGNGHGNLYPQRCADYMCWDGYKEKYAVTA